MFKILTITLLILLLGCDSKTKQEPKSEEMTPVSEERVSSFVLETIDGKVLHTSEVENGIVFEELKGKAVFLILFGYRCPPCLAEIPILKELVAEHNDLEIVAIEVQGYNNEKLKSFAQKKGVNYRLIVGDNHMNFIRYIQSRTKWSGAIPFIIGLDKKGEVMIIHAGGVGKQDLEGAYQNLIK